MLPAGRPSYKPIKMTFKEILDGLEPGDVYPYWRIAEGA